MSRFITFCLIIMGTLAIAPVSYSATCSGCCTKHGGVANSCAVNGKINCVDGTVSTSCTCAQCGLTNTGGNTATCQTKTETKTVACASGITGTMTQQRTYQCATTTKGYWSSWKIVTNNCVYPTFTGVVTKVTDGDTLTVKINSKNKVIRLAEIDAPEKCQEYGDQSRLSLWQLVMNKTVTVTQRDIDSYGRIVGHVTANHFTGTASAYQLEQGAAWVYDYYADDPTLDALEQTARANKVGLWASDKPMEPRLWRAGDYDCVSVCQ